MATQEKTWNVANRLHSLKDSDNPEVNHIIAGADEIYDDTKGAKQSDINAQTDAALSNRYTKADTYSKEQLDALITTPDVNYVTVATFADLPQTGEANTIYRVSSYDGTQVDASKYALYAWNGATYQLLAVRSAVGEVFDVSEYNSGATYETLTAALAAVPASVQRGGMSIKFVQSSDNKYVQYRYMGTDTTTAATFTNVANWQGVDDEPVNNSKNLITSGAVEKSVASLDQQINGFNGTQTTLSPELVCSHQAIGNSPTTGEKNIFVQVLAPTSANYPFALNFYAIEPNTRYDILIPKCGSQYQSIVLLSNNLGNPSATSNYMLRAYCYKITGNKEFNRSITLISKDYSYLIVVYDSSYGSPVVTKTLYQESSESIRKQVLDLDYNVKQIGERMDSSEENDNFTERVVFGSEFTKSLVTTTDVFQQSMNKLTEGAENIKFQKAINYPHRRVGFYPILPNRRYKINIPKANGNTGVAAYTKEVGYIPIDNTYSLEGYYLGYLAGEGAEVNIDLISKEYPYIAICYDNTGGTPTVEQWSYTDSQDSILTQLLEHSEHLKDLDEQVIPVNSLTVQEYINGCCSSILQINDSSTSNTMRSSVYDVEGLVGNIEIHYPELNNIYIYTWGFYDEIVHGATVGEHGPTWTSETPSQQTIYVNGTQKKYLVVNCLKTNQNTSAIYSSNVNVRFARVGERIDEVQEEIDYDKTIDIILPDKIYAVVGDTLQIFYSGIIKVKNYKNYDVRVSCTKGSQYRRYFEYTPTSNDVGNIPFDIAVMNNRGEELSSKTVRLITVAKPVSPSSQKNILCFGASATSQGIWCEEACRRLIGTQGSGNPAAEGVTNISFCGSMHKNLANYFGAGGWDWNSYITKGARAFRFQVSGVTAIELFSVYSNNGVIFTVREINITSDSGNILCSVTGATDAPTASGTLTKVSGSGDNTISFSSSELDSQNPLWDLSQNKFTFVNYANDYCNGQIDAVYVLLTWNGIPPYLLDFSVMKAQIKVFADTLHAEYPNAILKLMSMPLPCPIDGAFYGAAGKYGNFAFSDPYSSTVAALNMAKYYQEFANSDELSGPEPEEGVEDTRDAYNTFVKYVPVPCEFDCEYGLPTRFKLANTRVPIQVTTAASYSSMSDNSKVYILNNESEGHLPGLYSYQNGAFARDLVLEEQYAEVVCANALHPNNSGYYQIADTVYRDIVAEFCQ